MGGAKKAYLLKVIKAMMAELEMTPRELSLHVGMSKSVVGNVLDGRAEPGTRLYEAVMNAYEPKDEPETFEDDAPEVEEDYTNARLMTMENKVARSPPWPAR
jgi:hypothetical protein